MSLRWQVWLGVLVLLISIFIAAKMRYSGTAIVKLPPTNCNADLWNRVYEKNRLKVIEECTSVAGRVVSLHQSKDGDLHIALDPDAKSMLNLINAIHSHRTLVVEAVCDHAPEGEGAIHACAGFHSQIIAPALGDRVRVTGAYVVDRDNGWTEIHPVSRIESLE
jgi:hypothetical protein